MKYYQTVTTSTDPRECDEWIYYKGYSEEEAKAQRDYENTHHHDKKLVTEVRVYRLPDGRMYEDLDDDEQCDVLGNYNVL